MPYMYVLAYMVFIVAAGSVAAGRAQDAWIFALTGWFLIHGHACFLLFVPAVTAFAAAAVLWRRPRGVRGGGHPPVTGGVSAGTRVSSPRSALWYTFLMTRQFICTPARAASGRAYWFYTPGGLPPHARVLLRFSGIAVAAAES
jgi:hypothetical protein